MAKAKAEPILDVSISLKKSTSGTDQYGVPSGQRPNGVRVLMLEKWLQDETAENIRIVITPEQSRRDFTSTPSTKTVGSLGSPRSISFGIPDRLDGG